METTGISEETHRKVCAYARIGVLGFAGKQSAARSRERKTGVTSDHSSSSVAGLDTS